MAWAVKNVSLVTTQISAAQSNVASRLWNVMHVLLATIITFFVACDVKNLAINVLTAIDVPNVSLVYMETRVISNVLLDVKTTSATLKMVHVNAKQALQA